MAGVGGGDRYLCIDIHRGGIELYVMYAQLFYGYKTVLENKVY